MNALASFVEHTTAAFCHTRIGYPGFATFTMTLAFFGCFAFAAAQIYRWYEERCDYAETCAAIKAVQKELEEDKNQFESAMAQKQELLKDQDELLAVAEKSCRKVNSKVARSIAFCRQVKAMNINLHNEGQQLADRYEEALSKVQVAVMKWTKRRDQLIEETRQWEEYVHGLEERVEETNDEHFDFAEKTKENVLVLTKYFQTRFKENKTEIHDLAEESEVLEESNIFLEKEMQRLWRDADDLQGQIYEQEDYINELAAFAFDAKNEDELARVDDLLHEFETASEELEAAKRYIREVIAKIQMKEDHGEKEEEEAMMADQEDKKELVAAEAFVARMKNKYDFLENNEQQDHADDGNGRADEVVEKEDMSTAGEHDDDSEVEAAAVMKIERPTQAEEVEEEEEEPEEIRIEQQNNLDITNDEVKTFMETPKPLADARPKKPIRELIDEPANNTTTTTITKAPLNAVSPISQSFSAPPTPVELVATTINTAAVVDLLNQSTASSVPSSPASLAISIPANTYVATKRFKKKKEAPTNVANKKAAPAVVAVPGSKKKFGTVLQQATAPASLSASMTPIEDKENIMV